LKPLENYRVETFPMLEVTKVLETDSFKNIAECLQNFTIQLENTRDTFVSLDISQGFDYFQGNIVHRGRYESLVDIFQTFITKIVAKLRGLDYKLTAD
jgi:hypothetical protein